MATKFEPIRTKVTPAQMAEALRGAWRAQLGGEPRPTSLAVLLAQWAFETGRGKSMYNYNLGNAKAKPGGSVGWTFFECDEILPHAAAQKCAATGGALVTVTPYDATRSRVVFRPEHPACCFRAFATLDEGCADYLALLRGRFASAWPAVERGDPPLFARLLKQAHYYTAPEGHYASSITSLFFEFWPLCHPGAIDVRDVKGQQRALLALGYDLGPSGADGEAGKRTTAAVKAFQHARGLTADGKVGSQTKLALVHALEEHLLAGAWWPAPRLEHAPEPPPPFAAAPTTPTSTP